VRKARSGGKGSLLLFWAVVVVLVGALAVEGFLLLRPKPRASRPAAARRAMASGPKEIETFGDPSAPVKVKLYAPLALEWHQKTIKLLQGYDREHPGQIHVTLMPMGLEECDEEMGYSCAKVLVNGKNTFTLPDGREVTFEKQPNQEFSSYQSEDVITVLEQLGTSAAQ
jgi:hypothetical protein